jgi:hypothetical protein
MKRIQFFVGIILITLSIIIVGCSNNLNDVSNKVDSIDNNKLKLCDNKLETEYSRCLDSLAVSEKNLAYCEKIQVAGTTQYLKDGGGIRDKYECYWHAIYAIADESACSGLGKESPEKPGKDDCYSRLAITLQKPEYCNKISSKADNQGASMLDDCLSGTAQSSSDCEKVLWVNERNRCYARIAILNQDLSSCNRIESSGMTKTLENGIQLDPVKDDCIVRLARSSLNQQICDASADKTGCITAVQKELAEPTFCIQNKTGREKLECYINN